MSAAAATTTTTTTIKKYRLTKLGRAELHEIGASKIGPQQQLMHIIGHVGELTAAAIRRIFRPHRLPADAPKSLLDELREQQVARDWVLEHLDELLLYLLDRELVSFG